MLSSHTDRTDSFHKRLGHTLWTHPAAGKFPLISRRRVQWREQARVEIAAAPAIPLQPLTICWTCSSMARLSSVSRRLSLSEKRLLSSSEAAEVRMVTSRTSSMRAGAARLRSSWLRGSRFRSM